MSFSKNVSRCRCVCLSTRNVNTQSADGNKTNPVEALKMSVTSQLRNMSLSQWKLLIQIKEYLTKSTNEKGVFFIMNKEWANAIQRLPYIYNQAIEPVTRGNFDRTTLNTKSLETLDTNSENASAKDKQIHLNNSKTQLSLEQKLECPEEPSTKWKVQNDVVSKVSINSRTKHVISSVASAESLLSRLKRLEDLANHLNQYPEAKNLAVKEGAIQMLLRLRRNTRDEPTLSVIREACAILGHVDPLPGRGIRILSIDGGGIRGVLVIEMLKRLEELTGKRIHEMFDYICGVSTGAILACVLAPHRKPLDEVSILYKELSTKIFTQSAFWGTSNLVWSHSYYDTEMWEKMLKNFVGETQLIKTSRDPFCPKMSAISAVVNQARVSAFVFRNYSLPYKMQSQYMGSSQHQLWEAVRASAAAPSYFEEFKLGELLHQDGGILVNNPCAVAIHEAKQLWPESPIQCIVSFGTGRFNPLPSAEIQDAKVNGSSWKTKFLKILDSATDTEAVHTMLNDLMPSNVYYRFNPHLTEMVTMDEIRPEKIDLLEQDAAMYYRRNEETFQDAAKALLEPPSIMQQAHNWISLHRDLLGLKM